MAQLTIEQAMQVAIRHHQTGRLAEAEALYRRILEHYPDHPDALNRLGVLSRETGRTETAVELIGRVVTMRPDDAASRANLGAALQAAGRLDEAITAYRRAIALRDDLAEAHNNLGNALAQKGRLDEAIAALARAVALRPGSAQPPSNLGAVLTAAGRHDEAIAACQRAITVDPGYASAYNNLGHTLWDAGRLDQACAALERAIRLQPGHADAWNNLGNVQRDQGRLDLALTSFRRAIALKPGHAKAESNLLFNLHADPGHDAPSLLAEHRRWAQRHADPLAAEIRPHTNDRTPGRRLRIGYVSPDFRAHPVGAMLLSLLTHHDRRQVEIIGYCDVGRADAYTARLKALADGWHETVGIGDSQLADQIRLDRIDILVDLALHTAGNRMLLFARKPAPVEVTMLGLPTTTGLTTMDYRLTDPYLDPPGSSAASYSEESVHLPHCFWTFPPPEEPARVSSLPAARNGFVTFGCLNHFAKVSRPALELWLQILQEVPRSRLVIQAQPGSHLAAVRALFAEGGINAERISFLPRAGREAYLERYHDLDLGLDPFPYNGHTSTLDALWMGVPVVSLEGRTAVGRGGLSILSNLGLTELIARTPEQYVALAVAWARNLPRLAGLRAELRPRMLTSPLADGKLYAANVETAFRQMWHNWCCG